MLRISVFIQEIRFCFRQLTKSEAENVPNVENGFIELLVLLLLTHSPVDISSRCIRDGLSLMLLLTVEFLESCESLVDFSVIVFIIINCYTSHDLKTKPLKMCDGNGDKYYDKNKYKFRLQNLMWFSETH